MKMRKNGGGDREWKSLPLPVNILYHSFTSLKYLAASSGGVGLM